MLKGAQTEGIKELLDCVRGTEENDNRLRRDRMKEVTVRLVQNELTARQREVLLLLYGRGLTGREAAKILGVRETAVSNLKKRALCRLRTLAQYLIS